MSFRFETILIIFCSFFIGMHVNSLPVKNPSTKLPSKIRAPAYPLLRVRNQLDNSLHYSYYKSDNYIKSKSALHTNAVDDRKKLWPYGVVPYEISKKAFNKQETKFILKAMQEFHKLTCLKFVPRNRRDHNYVSIEKLDGCKSDIGRFGTGRQSLSLNGKDCLLRGVIMHELMHTIGFLHEQERNDRDNYVKIEWPNIKHEHRAIFIKSTKTVTMTTVYDYGSIMHYDKYAFSKNGEPTILPKKSDVNIGQRNQFSPIDLFEINVMYNCSLAKIREMNLDRK